MKQLVLVFLAMSLGIFACKDKEDEEINPYPIEGTWQVAGGVTKYKNPVTGQDEHQPVYGPDCDFDNALRFNPNHTMDALVGTLICDTDEVDEMNVGVWELNDNKSKLTLTPVGQAPQSYDVWILNQTDLQFSRKQNIQGIDFEVILRFRRK